MSTDKEKTETGGGDSPVLFGPSNDPRLSGRIDTLTGEALESAIARLGAFSDDVFGDEDEDPFPDGIRADAQTEGVMIPEPIRDEEGEELDMILDRLSSESDEDVAMPEEEAPSPAEEVRSLQDIARMQEADLSAPTVQRSPIADVLAGSGPEKGSDTEEGSGYHDPGLANPDEPNGSGVEDEADAYDPFGDMDAYAEYDEDLADEEEAPVSSETDEDLDLYDPDFPEDDLSETDFHVSEEEVDPEDETAEDQAGPSYGLPEPTPYGDGDPMGSLYGYEDEPDEAQEDPETGLDETGPDTEQDMLEDWPMPEDKVTENAVDPVREPVDTDWPSQADEEGTYQTGSALDDLITDLGDGPAEESEVDAPKEADETPSPSREDNRPNFLRRGPDGQPISGVLRPTGPNEEVSELEDPDTNEWVAPDPDGVLEPEEALADEVEHETGKATPEPVKGSGRKRMLLGVAALALVAAAAAGVYVMRPDLIVPTQVAQTEDPIPVPSNENLPLVPLPEMGEPAQEPVTDVAELEPVPVDLEPQVADLSPAPTPEGDGSSEPVPTRTVSPEVSDLLAELSREPAAPVPVGVSVDEFEALVTRVEDAEQARSDAEARASELTEEMTSLTDQITGLLQRDGEQAERLERMERLIRGQSAILAQFGQMEESLEQTQVVLLDVSARIGAVEGQNPADRDAVNRALADVEDRIQALTANMSILARMSIEGVDALRAPNASSATVGVQTAPTAQDPSGGADPVFRSETGGFRITSDPAGRIPSDVEKDDFIEGYGYVLDVLPASDGQRLVIMENGSVLVPGGE